MQIRLLEDRDTGAAKALWKQAFGDSDAFIETYFKNKILPGNSLGLFSGGLISVVHMLPFTIRVQGRALPSAYIAGAATDESHRHAGHMRTLLLESLRLMKSRGILMTHLYPFKHSFYEQYGWSTYSYTARQERTGAGQAANVAETMDMAVLHTLYHNMTRGMDGYVIRAEREWRWRLEELLSDNGKVYVLKSDDVPSAYMMVYEKDGEAEAIETVYTDPARAHELADHLLSLGYGRVRYSLVSQNAADEPHGMARVVDAAGLLGWFSLSRLPHTARIEDSFAEWNNIGCDHAQFRIDVALLAVLVHRGESLQSGQSPGIFAPRSTCIFEEY